MLRYIAVSALIALPLYYAAGQAASSKAAAPNSDASVLPEGPGKQVVLKSCTSCHNVRIAISKRGNEDDWAQVISQMIGRGANISDDDADTIVEYLAKHFGPSAPKPEEPAPPAQGSEPAHSPAPPSASAGTDQHSESKAPIKVNSATVEELESGLGLTPADAEAIVHYREQKGDFKNLQELLAVPGIDAEKIRNEQSKIVF